MAGVRYDTTHATVATSPSSRSACRSSGRPGLHPEGHRRRGRLRPARRRPPGRPAGPRRPGRRGRAGAGGLRQHRRRAQPAVGHGELQARHLRGRHHGRPARPAGTCRTCAPRPAARSRHAAAPSSVRYDVSAPAPREPGRPAALPGGALPRPVLGVSLKDISRPGLTLPAPPAFDSRPVPRLVWIPYRDYAITLMPTYSIGKGWTMRRATGRGRRGGCRHRTRRRLRVVRLRRPPAAPAPAPAAARRRQARSTLRLGFLENITHASALIAIKQGYFTKEPRPERHAQAAPVQHRHRGGHRPAGRPAGRRLRRAEPGHQGLADLGRQARSRSSPAPPRAAPTSWSRRASPPPPSSRARSWPPRRWATPRTWRCGTG